VLVRVRAVSLNRGDVYTLVGRPWLVRLSEGLVRPKQPRVGWDFAGTVEAVGAGEPEPKVGDEVFGVQPGAFGEYVTVSLGVAAVGFAAIVPIAVSQVAATRSDWRRLISSFIPLSRVDHGALLSTGAGAQRHGCGSSAYVFIARREERQVVLDLGEQPLAEPP
jgi:hypothetical protein